MLWVGVQTTTPADCGVAGLSEESINRREGNVFSGRRGDRGGRVCTDTVYDTELGNFWSTRCRRLEGIYDLVHSPGLVVLPDHILDWVCPSRVYDKG